MTNNIEHTSQTLATKAQATSSSNGGKRKARFDRRSGFNRNQTELAATKSEQRYAYSVSFADVEADLDAMIGKAVACIAEGDPVEDAILGHYVHIASLVRSISFREGKLLEYAVERLAKVNPNLTVLTQSLRLPMVKAALETVTSNNWSSLEGITIDCEAPAKGSYTPDLIIVNREHHAAFILDLKRSLASYGDTSRLDELRIRMMTSALVLPDWLYKNHKRLMVDTVGVAIIDGASRPSNHTLGIWALDEIDDLLEVDGAAACMAELRRRFGKRVRELLEAEARTAIDLAQDTMTKPDTLSESETLRLDHKPNLQLNSIVLPDDDPYCCFPDDYAEAVYQTDDEPAQAGGDVPLMPFRIKVGFAKSPRLH